MNIRSNTNSLQTPAEVTKILNKDLEGEAHHADWNYRSIIGKLLFLEKSTRPELACAVHQCASCVLAVSTKIMSLLRFYFLDLLLSLAILSILDTNVGTRLLGFFRVSIFWRVFSVL